MTTTTLSSSACIVRPPWPDELPRIAEAFPARVNRTVALHPLVLVAPGSPERIVGFAGVLEPVEGESGLKCIVRPRYIDSPDGDRLIAAALKLGQSLGARSVRIADEVAEGTPLLTALRRARFVQTDANRAGEEKNDMKGANFVWYNSDSL